VALPRLEVRKQSAAVWVALALVTGGVGVAETAFAAPAISQIAVLPTNVVAAAQSQLGVREVPENRGRRVREYQKSVKNDHYALDAPWCSSFVTWAGLQANDPTPFRSAIVSEWIVAADNGRHGMSFVRQSSVRAGDIVALKKAGNWQHMGIVSSVSNGITVISGNTVAPDKKADGVFEKPLTNWTKKGYVATFIRNSG
jgi:CHAP domain